MSITILIVFIVVISLIILFSLVISANILFDRKVRKEIEELFEKGSYDTIKKVKRSDLNGLPKCVKKWLMNSGVVGSELTKTVHLKQDARMRLKRDQSWMPVEAEQYFTAEKPGFIWKAMIEAAPFLHIVGRDRYIDGKGNMLIKVLSLIPVANSSGKEMDQGTLVRYLAETVWFPSAVLSDYIEWNEIDSRTAEATMTYGGISSSGRFRFDEDGEVVSFTAYRYREVDGEHSKEKWRVEMKEHKKLEGVKIPTEGSVIWELEDGDFEWFRFEITRIEYNDSTPPRRSHLLNF